jgi:hypothetical protein
MLPAAGCRPTAGKSLKIAAGLQPVKYIANRPAYGDLLLEKHGEIEQNWRIKQYFD